MADQNGKSLVVLAGAIAKPLLQEVQTGLRTISVRPHLVGFLANEDPSAQMYANWTAKTCNDNGFAFTLRHVERDALEEAILDANVDATVHGIIVYYPIYDNRQDQYLQQIVDVSKDVEGLSHRYIFNMYQNIRFLDDVPIDAETSQSVTTDTRTSSIPKPNADLPSTRHPAFTKQQVVPRQKSILPCTPLAIIKTLEHLHIYNPILPYGNRLHGRTITIINRSEVVGRPLAALLANDGALVYSVDVDSVQEYTRGTGLRKRRHEAAHKEGWGLEQCLPLSDVVISGVPGEGFKVPLDLVRDGAVCVNFSSEKNFAPEVKEKASIYVPAIGKVTIVILLRNLLRIIQNQRSRELFPANSSGN